MNSADLRTHVDPKLCIEVRKRFVHQKERRLHNDNARESDALLFASRQLIRISVFVSAQSDEFQRIDDFIVDVRIFFSARFQSVSDVFVDRHVRKKRVVLEHESDRAFVYRHARHVFAFDGDAAARRNHKARDHAERRRFAAARRS